MGVETSTSFEDSVERGQSYAQFRVCGTWLAVAAASVETIGNVNTVHPLPLVPEYISGQFSMDGEVRILLDMVCFLGMHDEAETESTPESQRVVVLQSGRLRAAISVAETSKLVHLSPLRINHADVLNNGRLNAFLAGEYESELGRVGILDVARLLESARV